MMEQAGIVEQSDGKDFKARIFGKWKENGDEGPLGPSCPSRPPRYEGMGRLVNEKGREAGSSHKSQLSSEQKSKKNI